MSAAINFEAEFHKLIVALLSKKDQGRVMGAFRTVEALRAPVQAQGDSNSPEFAGIRTQALSEREQFEAWAVTNDGGWVFPGALRRADGAADADYADDDVHSQWEAWQARATLAQAPQSDDAQPNLKAAPSSELQLELRLREGPRFQCQASDCRSLEDSPGQFDTCPSCGRKGYLCGAFKKDRDSKQWKDWEQRITAFYGPATQVKDGSAIAALTGSKA